MKSLFTKFLLAATLLSPLQVAAQSEGPSVTFSPLVIDGLTIGRRLVVDDAFAAKYNIAVPRAFEIVYPTSDDRKMFFDPAPGGTGIVKVTFTTLEEQVRSNIQIVPFTLDMAPMEDRLQGARNLLQQALETSIPDLERSEVLVLQTFEVGPYAAIEVVAKYDGGADGLIILRVVAIPDPDSVNGLLVVMNTVVKNNEMEQIVDILEFEAAQALNSIRFR